jgi:hypothetical protein
MDIAVRTSPTPSPFSRINGEPTKSNVALAPAATRLDQTMIRLRSSRSAITPPRGEVRKAGNVLAVRTAAVRRGD